ncbi:MAG: tetratricopeptide repeat protein [Bryobacteraceae bacterium]|nr:tetratricopeptide repeat protein [Bryobacteraceae bacterium]
MSLCLILTTALAASTKLERTEQKLRDAIEAARKSGSRADALGKQVMLAAVLADQARYDESQAILVAILPELPRAMSIQALDELARGHMAMGRLEDADAALSQAGDRIAGVSEEVAVQLRSSLYGTLGVLRMHQARLDEAETFLKRSLAAARDLNGRELRVALALGNLGQLYLRERRLALAEERLREGLKVVERTPGDHELLKAQFLQDLGSVRVENGDLREAGEMLERALAVLRGLLGDDHPAVAAAWNNAGALHARRQHWDRAAERFRRAAESLRGAAGDHAPQLVSVELNLAVAAAKLGDPGAAKMFEKVVAELRRRRNPALLRDALTFQAEHLRSSGRKEEARRARREAKSLEPLAHSLASVHTVDIRELKRP